MPLSVPHLVLRAKQLEIKSIRHLAARVELADVIGQLIHALQRERGATSIYLASGGLRFAAERQVAVEQTQPIEADLRALFAKQLAPDQGVSSQTLSLMAWVLLDLDALSPWRLQFANQTTSAHDSVAAFSRLIAGLVELIFQLADASLHPGISGLLVAFVHLVQGKESAGQERAVGAQLFASGASDEAEQQRVVQLIEAQERSLAVFEQFAQADLRGRWQQHQLTPTVAQLERMRRTLCMVKAGAALDTSLSESWFEVTSARITEMWQLQEELVQCLRQACAAQIQDAERNLQDSEGLLQQLRDNPPRHADAVGRFFNADQNASDAAPVLTSGVDAVAVHREAVDQPSVAAMAEIVQTQSARLVSMELELDAARRALHERKVIERAKGALMSRLGMTEEAAFRALQKASMDHNRKLLDVAEATLTLPDVVFASMAEAQKK